MYLSKIQKAAVEYIETPLLLCAGAGSGKTRVLTHKFAYLINELNYDSNRILCITFTNKAAKELSERVYKLIKNDNLNFEWVRTIHSACLRMLRNYLYLIDYNIETTIFGTTERNTLIKNLLDEFKFDKRDKKAFWDISEILDNAKNHNDPISFLKELNLEKFQTDFKNNSQVIDIFYRYMELLKLNNALDYNDILWYTNFLLRTDKEFKNRWVNYFQYILIDEYQDINNIQNQIFQILNNNESKLTAVGDDYQSIFLWRYAEPKFFIEFEKYYPNSRKMFMEQNYRSTIPIIQASNELIKNNKYQIHKKCFTSKESCIKPSIVVYSNPEQEAYEIIQNCKIAVERFKLKFKDIAILFRVRSLSRSFEEKLIENQIPYKIVGAIEFLERREIKDLIAYLSFLNNLKDRISFDRLIKSPRRGIGQKTVDKILKFKGEDIADKIIFSLKNNKFKGKTKKALSQILDLISVRKTLSPFKLIEKILKDFDFDSYLKKISSSTYEYESRIDNINEFKLMASKYDDISSFMESIQLLYENKKENSNCVNLMTIHAAKGLEFKVVFVVGIEKNILPHHKATNNLDTLEEERRLLYVAMTRAESFLFLSFCKERSCFNYFIKDKMSPFLHEIKHMCNFVDTTKKEIENQDDKQRNIR